MKIKLIDFGLEKDHYPFRPHENDAGADVYMPYDCTLKPGEIARIPLGFGLMIPDGYAGYVFPRSSMAAKGLVCELPPIDSGYRGEIHAIISNVSSESQTLLKNTRVGQLVITPVQSLTLFLILERQEIPVHLEVPVNNHIKFEVSNYLSFGTSPIKITNRKEALQ